MASAPSFVDPLTGLGIVFSANIVVPIAGFLMGIKFRRHNWLFNLFGFIWVVVSVPLFLSMVIPRLPPDEAPGPGDGLILLPLLFEVGFILVIYCVAFGIFLIRVGLDHFKQWQNANVGVQ